MSSPKARLIQASEELQELAEHTAAMVLGIDEPPTPLERSQVAGALGRIVGIGIGLGWIAKYEMSDDEAH